MPKNRVHSGGSYFNKPTKFTNVKPKKKIKSSTVKVVHSKKKIGTDKRKKNKTSSSKKNKKTMIEIRSKEIVKKMTTNEEKTTGIIIKECVEVMDLETLEGDDLMDILFAVFRESIEQTNEDKRYFLRKLAEMNEIAEAQGDYLKDFMAAAEEAGSSGGDTSDIDELLGKTDEIIGGFNNLFDHMRKTKNRCEKVKKRKEILSALNLYTKGYLAKENILSKSKKIKK